MNRPMSPQEYRAFLEEVGSEVEILEMAAAETAEDDE
jgi:hypothetical protein